LGSKADHSPYPYSCLKVFVHAGIDPVPVLRDGYLAVVRRDRLRNPAKVGQRIVVDPDPVRDVVAGHAFDIEIVAERQGGNKDGYGRGQTGIVTVVERQRFTGEIQFQIDAGKQLKRIGKITTIHTAAQLPWAGLGLLLPPRVALLFRRLRALSIWSCASFQTCVLLSSFILQKD